MIAADPAALGIRTDGDRSGLARRMTLVLVAAVLAVSLLSLGAGASGVSLVDTLSALARGEALSPSDSLVLFQIRLPRLVTGLLVGAALAVSGAVMQGLFRNPLADPGLVGVSAGAGLGAITAIVLGGALPPALAAAAGVNLVPLAAFFGGLAATLVLHAIASRRGRTSVATMLLGGIALAALTGAASGLLIYLADDSQLRTLTFWSMGSLAGASWPQLIAAGPLMMAALIAAPFLARGLNGLALGEAAAFHIVMPVERTNGVALLTVAASVGAEVAI